MIKPLLRNCLFGGLLIFLIFWILHVTASAEQRSMEDIGNTRSLILMLNGMILPGLFFGIAVVLAWAEAHVWKRLVFILASTIVYMVVAYMGLEGDLFLFASAALAGPTMVVMANALLRPDSKMVQKALVAFPLSALAVFPLYVTLSSGQSTIESTDFLGMTSFIFWPGVIAFILSWKSPSKKEIT